MLEIFLLISYWKCHACARSLEASCKAARCRWHLFGWQQCVHYMLCAPRPIVGGAGCGGWSSLNLCGGGSTRRPRQALQCRSQRRPSGLRGPCVCVTVFACVSGSITGREGMCGHCLFGWFAGFPVYCSPLDPTLPSASLGAPSDGWPHVCTTRGPGGELDGHHELGVWGGVLLGARQCCMG